MKIFKNDVLVLDIDSYGILKKKTFYNIDDMNNIKKAEATTDSGFDRNSFVYDFMSSMRQKINDPLGQRAKKRKEIKFDENETSVNYSKQSFILSFIGSIRQKIDDPLGKKRIKN